MGNQPSAGCEPRVYLPGLRRAHGRRENAGIFDTEGQGPLKGRRLRWAPATMAATARIAREAQSRKAAATKGCGLMRCAAAKVGIEWQEHRGESAREGEALIGFDVLGHRSDMMSRGKEMKGDEAH